MQNIYIYKLIFRVCVYINIIIKISIFFFQKKEIFLPILRLVTIFTHSSTKNYCWYPNNSECSVCKKPFSPLLLSQMLFIFSFWFYVLYTCAFVLHLVVIFVKPRWCFMLYIYAPCSWNASALSSCCCKAISPMLDLIRCVYNLFKPFFLAFDFFFLSSKCFDFFFAMAEADEFTFGLPDEFVLSPFASITSADVGRHFGWAWIPVYNLALFSYAL